MNDNVGSADQTSDQADALASPSNGGTIKQFAAIVAAVICLSLAGVGFFLPVLPCTPFVLLASYLLVHGSPSMHRRLRASRFFGRILADWEDRKGIRRTDKVRAISIVLAGLILTMTFSSLSKPLICLMLFFVAIGLWVIIRLPIAKDVEE